MVLIPDKVRVEHGLTINEKIIPWGAKWTKNYDKYKIGDRYKADRLLSNNTGKVAALTIHNTPGDADAETYTRATYPNQNMKTARVHYYVDDKEAWQNLRDDEVGWHAGDGNGPGNSNTIAIEILTQGKAVKDGNKAEVNGILLTAILMVKHNLTIKNIYPHKHWSGKNCPINILPRWNSFLKDLEVKYNEIKGSDTVVVYKRGDIGAGVRALQNDLIKLGYDLSPYGADGSFGPAMEGIVKVFQKDHGLVVDGSFGPASQNKLKELLAKASSPDMSAIEKENQELKEKLKEIHNIINR